MKLILPLLFFTIGLRSTAQNIILQNDSDCDVHVRIWARDPQNQACYSFISYYVPVANGSTTTLTWNDINTGSGASWSTMNSINTSFGGCTGFEVDFDNCSLNPPAWRVGTLSACFNTASVTPTCSNCQSMNYFIDYFNSGTFQWTCHIYD